MRRDRAEAEPEDDLPFALIQMKTEMLEKVNEALRRCDQGRSSSSMRKLHYRAPRGNPGNSAYTSQASCHR